MEGYLFSTIDGSIRAPLEIAWKSYAELDPKRAFEKRGPVPAVTGVANQEGPWDRLGQTRNVMLTDGSVLSEEIVEVVAPAGGRARLVYEVQGFSAPIGLLTNESRSEIDFTADGEMTRVHWVYGYRPKSVVARVPLSLFVPLLWQGYVQKAFENSKKIIEAEAGRA